MPYYVLNFDPDIDQFSLLVGQIDANLNQYGSGSPVGVRAAARPGITYINSDNNSEYVATEADGTVGGTIWVQRVYSIANATTEVYGVLKIASQSDVDAGTATDLAVTPSSLGALARSTDLSAEIAARIAGDASLDSDLAAVETVVNAAASAATPSTLVKRDGSGRAKVANGSAADDIATKGQMDTADAAIQSQVTSNTSVINAADFEATASVLVKRDANAQFKAAAGTDPAHVIIKSQFDSAILTVTNAAAAAQSDVDALETVVGTPVSAPTANAIVKRDAAGRAQVVSPSVGSDIANKTYADALGVSAATASTIMRRDAAGRAQVVDPSASADIATKNYADALGTSAPTVSTIMRRDAAGRAQVVDPSASADIATKNYVDTKVGGIPFGGDGSRSLPTSGSISGVYMHSGNWTSTGTLTVASGTRIFISGNMQLDHDMVVSTGVPGGIGSHTSGATASAGNGANAGNTNPVPTDRGAGGGGGCGGVGGFGGSNAGASFAAGGGAWTTIDQATGGSSGGGGWSSTGGAAGGNGGAAGGFLYIEVAGTTIINANISANGGNGVNGGSGLTGGGGAGSGGVIDIRSKGNFTINAGKTISANGGVGGNSGSVNAGNGAGGGGGIVGAWSEGTLTNSGSITVSGGAAGTIGSTTQVASAGATGFIRTLSATGVCRRYG